MNLRLVKASRLWIGLFGVMALLLALPTSASVVAQAGTPEATIAADVAAQNNRDWTSYLDLRSRQPEAPENRNDLARLRNKHPEENLLANIRSARLVNSKALPLDLAAALTRMGKYVQSYGEIKAYYVGIDYEVDKPARALKNGVNYRLYVLGLEQGRWVIVEASEIPIQRMVDAGYGFGTLDEAAALQNQSRMRQPSEPSTATGIYGCNYDQSNDHLQPFCIRVYRTATGDIDEVDFYTYVTNVLPNEWGISMPAPALQAGAAAIKAYAWYHMYYAKYPGQGFDVKDNTGDQVYRPGSGTADTVAAVDAVQGVSYDEDGTGQLFEAHYWDGTGKASTSGSLPIRSTASDTGKIVATVGNGAPLVFLDSGLTIANGKYWWLVKTNGTNFTSYQAGWVPEANVTTNTGYPPSTFRGWMSQWGTRYWSDTGVPSANKNYDEMVHWFYDGSPSLGGNKARQFTYTADRTPNPPTNVSPAAGASNVSVTPVLQGSSFDDPDAGDTHWKTWWQVRRAADGAVVWDSWWRTTDLTSTTVPAGYLQYYTCYEWQVRYMDNHGAWSEPRPTPTKFGTIYDASLLGPSAIRAPKVEGYPPPAFSLYLPLVVNNETIPASLRVYLPLVFKSLPPPPPLTCN